MWLNRSNYSHYSIVVASCPATTSAFWRVECVWQTPHYIRHRPYDKIRAAMLVHLNLALIDQHRRQDLRVALTLDGAVMLHHVQVVARIAHIQTPADTAGDGRDGCL